MKHFIMQYDCRQLCLLAHFPLSTLLKKHWSSSQSKRIKKLTLTQYPFEAMLSPTFSEIEQKLKNLLFQMNLHLRLSYE